MSNTKKTFDIWMDSRGYALFEASAPSNRRLLLDDAVLLKTIEAENEFQAVEIMENLIYGPPDE